MRTITYEDVLKNESKYILVDVRTPKEFEHSTIPGAVNIPILSNDDHSIVGTIYKQDGRKAATKKALELFSPNLLSIYEEFDQLVKKDIEIVVFCARGGMRSTTLVSFLQTLAIPVVKLDFGYKNYRQYIIDNLENVVNSKKIITLYGNTGVGKTQVLYKLKEKGLDIVDLEMCANHRGSFLGHIGIGSQNSQKMFESLVFDYLRKSGEIVIVEGESKRIGKIIMPTYLHEKVHSGTKLMLLTSIENRVENIKNDYLKTGFDQKEIITALNSLRKYMSNEVVDEYINAILVENYEFVIENLIINYYDKKYKSSGETSMHNIEFEVENEAVKKIVSFVESISINI